jgi:hypothetical protein
MGEIKSTLDLVMERTQHLSMSSQEKAQQQRIDFKKRLAGLLQKFSDQALTVTDLRNRMDNLKEEFNLSEPEMISKAVLARIDPDRNNDHWLALIEGLMPSAHAPLKNILTTYRNQKVELNQKIVRVLLDRLNRYYGIRGSAVIPNPQKDPHYQKDLAVLHADTQTKITAIPT